MQLKLYFLLSPLAVGCLKPFLDWGFCSPRQCKPGLLTTAFLIKAISPFAAFACFSVIGEGFDELCPMIVWL